MTISIGMILLLASLIGAFLAVTGMALCRGKAFSWIAGFLGLGVGWMLFAIASATSRSRGRDRQWHVDYERLARNEFTFFALLCTVIGIVFILKAVFQKQPKAEEQDINLSSSVSSDRCCALPKYGDRPETSCQPNRGAISHSRRPS
jgi:hypothetical protein